MTPVISVVMSVYNCEKYVGETIQSVIDQTFRDWEFIIINDSSTDKSAEIIQGFSDKRIIFINNSENKGQCNNLNKGISVAKGKYIARLDHDDICYPERFEKQYNYMESHPEVVLLGSAMDTLKDGVIIKNPHLCITGANEMRFSHTFFNFCMPHSSFFMRSNTLREAKIEYNVNYKFCEDFKLLLDLLRIGEIDYIKEPLIAYRIFPEQCTQVYDDKMKRGEVNAARKTYLEGLEMKDLEIFKKAFEGNLSSLKEYKIMEKALLEYASLCDVPTNLGYNRGVYPFVLRKIWNEQKKSIGKFIYYLTNKYIGKRRTV